jgi:type IV pilus assembly protein PilQ
VPWDQALDIVMTTKGLDMRRNGNVIIVAPAEEIAAREQADLQAQKALQTLEPLRSEFIQVNYAKASDLATLIKGSGAGGAAGTGKAALLSDRGSVAIDVRTNTLLVSDTSRNLENIRRLVTTLDIPVRQVSIETRVVIVNDDYSRDLGVRFGATVVKANGNNGLYSMTGTSAGSDTIVGSGLNNLNTSGTPFPVSVPPIGNRYNVNLPISNPAGSIALAILDSDYLVDLELSAMQAEGNGKIVSTPRVIATNQHEARIRQGVEIPYQESSSSGATTTQFKEAVLSLTVTPQITPDDRIIMDLLVTKDNVGQQVTSATGGSVPSIDTRSVTTSVAVNDGQTVVLGGIYETEIRETINKVPVLGDIPGLGYLFRSRSNVNNNAELLIFVTPKIVREGARIE